jgi:hypothetical protein
MMMHTGSSPNLATPMLQPWAKQAQLSIPARPKTTLCAKQSSDHHPTPHAMPHGMRQWLCQIIRVHWVEPFRCGPAPSSSPCAPQYLGQAEEGQPGQQACIVGKYSDSGRQTDSQTDTCPVGNKLCAVQLVIESVKILLWHQHHFMAFSALAELMLERC